MSKDKQLSLDLVQSQLKPQQRLTVSQDTLDEINRLSEDPDYGQEFLDSYLDHLNIFKQTQGRSHDQYLNAVKFFCLVEAGNSLTDAYIKVFPERFEARKQNYSFDKRNKDIMRGEASRYNKTVLVTEIARVAAIPVSLIHRHVLHEAILEQAHLMRNAKSEMVRQRAGATLITELKPAEDQVLNVKVEDGATSAIEELRRATEDLANREHSSVMAGIPLKEISERDIITVEVEVEDVDNGEATHFVEEEEPIDHTEVNKDTKRWSI